VRTATEYLWFSTKKHREYLNITHQVEEIVRRSGVVRVICPNQKHKQRQG